MEERFDNSHDSNPLSEGRSKKGRKKRGEEDWGRVPLYGGCGMLLTAAIMS
jgi:hypothetical protein